MRKLILAAIAAVMCAAPAIAADANPKASTNDAGATERAPSWSGLYVGAQCGYGYTQLSAEDSNGGIDASGNICGIRGGLDLARGSLLVGAYGEFNFSDRALEFGPVSVVEIDQDWAVMGRIGFIHGKALFYGAFGYTELSGQAPAFGGADVEATGWKGALGLEYMVAPNFTIGGEISRAWLDADKAFGSGAEDVIDLVDDRAMIRATYKVNGYTFGF